MRLLMPAAVAAALVLCSASTAFAQDQHGHDHKHEKKSEAKDNHSHDHGHHHHTAPHGGTLIAFGDESAHLELVLDASNGQLTGYVLDGEAVNAIRVQQPEIRLQISGGDVSSSQTLSLKPVESPLTGEKAGNTSQFEATSAALKGKKKFTVVVEDITIKGQNFKQTKSAFPEGNH